MKIDGIDYPPQEPVPRLNLNRQVLNKLVYLAAFYLSLAQAMARPQPRSNSGEDLIYDETYDPNMPRPPYYDNPPEPPIPPDDQHELWIYWKTVNHPFTALNNTLGIVAAGDHTAGFYNTAWGSGRSVAECFDFNKFVDVLRRSIGYNSSSALVDYAQEYCAVHYDNHLARSYSHTMFDSLVYVLSKEDCELFKANYLAQIEQCSDQASADAEKLLFIILIVLLSMVGGAILVASLPVIGAGIMYGVGGVCYGIESACTSLPSLNSFRKKDQKSIQDTEGHDLDGSPSRRSLLSNIFK